MQLLLNGGSLTQILAAANAANATANTAGEGTGVKPVSGQSRATGQTLTVTVAAEKPKLSRATAGEAKSAGVSAAGGDASHLLDAGNALSVGGQGAPAGESSNNGDSGKSRESGRDALGGAGAEALHTAGAATNGEAAKAPATNFAFAVRLTSDGAQAPAAAHAQTAAASAETPRLAMQEQHALTAPGATAEAAAAAKTGEHHEESSNGASLMMFAAGHAPAGQTDPSGASAAAEAAAAPAATETDPAAAAPGEPVRNIRLQLAGENNQRVDIRLVDVAGEMRVSVRAGDTRLAQTLQEHIPDLANRLEGQQVRAEIWTPRTESPSSSNGSNQNGAGGQPRGGGDSSGGDGQRRQGNGQQRNQPDWVDDYEDYSSPAQTSRSNQTWPQ